MRRTLPILLVGGHLDEPPEWAKPIIAAIGLAALRWGRLEQHLHGLVLSINKQEFGPVKYHEITNANFERKLLVFEQWFALDPRRASASTPH